MQAVANRKDSFTLMMEGALALSKIQSNGIKMNMDYLLGAEKTLKQMVTDELKQFLQLKDVQYWERWASDAGLAFNPNSDDQLAHVLFKHKKYRVVKKTDSGKPSVDKNVLEELLEETGNPMIKSLMRMRVLDKAFGTYIQGLLRETNEDGFLRPFFNLHLARTFRSSSNNPNFQNLPIRDGEIAELIRTAFIPRQDRHILELDFKGIEVQMAYFYHRDPVMESFLTDKKKDMHSMAAMKCFLLAADEWNKKTRQTGKGSFVFPEFYGSYWDQVGDDLWKAIALEKLNVGKNNDGISIYAHLKKHGIHNVDDFKQHIKKVEDWFWNDQFTVYNQWKKDWVAEYHQKGYFDSLTGFRYQGILKKNEVINYAVQGSAFHMLLRVLIELQKWLEKYNMKTLIIGQIHDSLVLDIVPSEMDDVLHEALCIISQDLPKYYPFIDVPMTIEAELAPLNAPWLAKKEISLDPYI